MRNDYEKVDHGGSMFDSLLERGYYIGGLFQAGFVGPGK